MFTITLCSRCGKDFMYHRTDTHLFRETQDNLVIQAKYPIQDDIWPRRRWNVDKTKYYDLSDYYDVICQDCDELENMFMKVVESDGKELKEYNDSKNGKKSKI